MRNGRDGRERRGRRARVWMRSSTKFSIACHVRPEPARLPIATLKAVEAPGPSSHSDCAEVCEDTSERIRKTQSLFSEHGNN